MITIALGLLALYVFFGFLFYGLANAARRADSQDARARAITKQNLRRRRAAMAEAGTASAGAGMTIV